MGSPASDVPRNRTGPTYAHAYITAHCPPLSLSISQGCYEQGDDGYRGTKPGSDPGISSATRICLTRRLSTHSEMDYYSGLNKLIRATIPRKENQRIMMAGTPQATAMASLTNESFDILS